MDQADIEKAIERLSRNSIAHQSYIDIHEGRITVLWEQQHKLNETIAIDMKTFERRLTTLEKRIVWIAGTAAGAGSILGPIAKSAFAWF